MIMFAAGRATVTTVTTFVCIVSFSAAAASTYREPSQRRHFATLNDDSTTNSGSNAVSGLQAAQKLSEWQAKRLAQQQNAGLHARQQQKLSLQVPPSRAPAAARTPRAAARMPPRARRPAAPPPPVAPPTVAPSGQLPAATTATAVQLAHSCTSHGQLLLWLLADNVACVVLQAAQAAGAGWATAAQHAAAAVNGQQLQMRLVQPSKQFGWRPAADGSTASFRARSPLSD